MVQLVKYVKDYVLSNGKCVYKPGCESLTVDGEGCYKCLYPFTTVDDKKCEKKSPCITWRDGKCSTCGDYYFVSNGVVLKYLLSIAYELVMMMIISAKNANKGIM